MFEICPKIRKYVQHRAEVLKGLRYYMHHAICIEVCTSLAITAFLMVRPLPCRLSTYSFTTPKLSLNRGTAFWQTYPSLFVHSQAICARTVYDPYKQQPCKLTRRSRPLASDRLGGRRGGLSHISASLARILDHCCVNCGCALIPFRL